MKKVILCNEYLCFLFEIESSKNISTRLYLLGKIFNCVILTSFVFPKYLSLNTWIVDFKVIFTFSLVSFKFNLLGSANEFLMVHFALWHIFKQVFSSTKSDTNKYHFSKSNFRLKYLSQIPNFQYENVKYWISDENKKSLAVWFSCNACHKTFMDLKKEIGFILRKDDIFTFAA